MINYAYNPEALKNIYNSTLITGEEEQKLEAEYRKLFKDNLIVKDGGFTVYSKSNSSIELSKGCQACKAGKWLCLFVGYNCNMNCPFCPQPKADNFVHVFDDKDLTSHGTLAEVKYYLSIAENLEGISYSGGEPLLYLDKVLNIAKFVKENRKDMYQWIYTNGVLVNEETLKKLSEVGINEMRFDLAATKFSKEIIDKIALAKKYIDRITVEIPAIPEIKVLMENNLIDNLVAMGVSQFNISEMNLAQEVNMKTYGKDTVIVGHKGFFKGLSLLESKEIYYELLDYVIKHKLDVLMNNCNSGAKFVQIMNRQKNQRVYESGAL
jgi:pyruvate formate-lyase activating enzyme-like uncharacterized protein